MVTGTPSTVPVPVWSAAGIMLWSRSRYPVGLASPPIANAPWRWPSVLSTRPAKPGSDWPGPVSDDPGASPPSSLPRNSQMFVPSSLIDTLPMLETFDTASMAKGSVSTVPVPVTLILGLLVAVPTSPEHTVSVPGAGGGTAFAPEPPKTPTPELGMESVWQTGIVVVVVVVVVVGAVGGSNSYATLKLPALVVELSEE